MIRAVCLLILLIPSISYSQTDLVLAKSFRSQNVINSQTLFIENESILPPEEGEPTYSITITVTDIRNKEGVIRFKFYDDTTPFPHDQGFLRIVVQKSEVINNSFTATYYGFTAKQMGIALQDDENSNRVLDLGWFFPKEGHAFSDYHHTALRRPVYSDFRFLLEGDKQVIMKMKYY